jgi:hypothetical protein
MTKGKIITISVSVALTEDTGKDLHTELTGIAHECLTALRAMIPDSESRSALWKVETLEDIGVHENPRSLRRHRIRRDPHPGTHRFVGVHSIKFPDLIVCAICGCGASALIHGTANDKPQ